MSQKNTANKCDKVPCSSDADYKYISIGHSKCWGFDCLMNISTGGIYGDIKCHKDATDVIKGLLSMGWTNTEVGKGIQGQAKGVSAKNADAWNARDPRKIFPLSANASCDELFNFIKSLQQELVTTDTAVARQSVKVKNAAQNYKTKLTKYLAEVQDIYNSKKCDDVRQKEKAAIKCDIDHEATKRALELMRQQSTKSGLVNSINPITIGLVVGGILFVSIIGIALSTKKKLA